MVTLYEDEKSGAKPISTPVLFDCITTSNVYNVSKFKAKSSKSTLIVIIPSNVLAAMVAVPELAVIISLETPSTFEITYPT